ncbi:MAG: AMP-binding protein [Deltaproteobacteria bacterium]|nr:AMP-binding protein [Deltaproteobacteria bacterium]
MFKSAIVFIVNCLLRLRYRIEIKGLDPIRKNGGDGILFLPNHPALIDPVIVNSVLQRSFQVRPLVTEGQVNHPILRYVMAKVRALIIPDLSQVTHGEKGGRDVVHDALNEMSRSLEHGDNLLVYPAGRIYRTAEESLRGSSAVDRLVKSAPNARVVLVRTTGLWGSQFSRARGNVPHFFAVLLRMLPLLVLNSLLFMPKRQVTVELVEAADFPREGGRQQINRYLELFYNESVQPAQHIPYRFWQGGAVENLPEPELVTFSGDASHVPLETRRLVEDKLRQLSGITTLTDELTLANDLGLDSLAVMELVGWLTAEFAVDIDNLEALQTVSDCLLAARGEGLGHVAKPLKPADAAWLADDWTNGELLQFDLGENLATLILRQARAHKNRVIVADQNGGCRTWKKLMTGVLALRPAIKAIPESSVAIMLPASVAACLCWLTLVLCGKRPVMLNWTTGERNMAHALAQTGAKTVLTSSLLIDKLKGRGIQLDNVDASWFTLESFAANLSPWSKLVAATKGLIFWHFLSDSKINDTAAVLFTSGSESFPKSVALSHANILANMRDLTAVIPLRHQDRLLGMLPPFHSLGLSGTLVMPLCLGLKTVYYPNPTDGAVLAQHVENYQASVVIGTPTFLAGMAGAAQEKQLSSLRMIFTGAEKCPDSTYTLLAQRCKQATVCEGYGVTECSPLISVNHPNQPIPGTIGFVMPSMDYMLIHPETGKPVDSSGVGILLVRGPNVFSGYLEQDVDSPFVQHDGYDWYNTGDLVQLNEHGGLTFCGRLKRFVKMGGEMISLPAIEAVLLEGVARMERVELGDGPMLAVKAANPDSQPELVLFSAVEVTRQQVNEMIRGAGLSPLHNIRKVITIDSIPVLGTGKTDYRQLRELLQQGESV